MWWLPEMGPLYPLMGSLVPLVALLCVYLDTPPVAPHKLEPSDSVNLLEAAKMLTKCNFFTKKLAIGQPVRKGRMTLNRGTVVVPPHI